MSTCFLVSFVTYNATRFYQTREGAFTVIICHINGYEILRDVVMTAILAAIVSLVSWLEALGRADELAWMMTRVTQADDGLGRTQQEADVLRWTSSLSNEEARNTAWFSREHGLNQAATCIFSLAPINLPAARPPLLLWDAYIPSLHHLRRHLPCTISPALLSWNLYFSDRNIYLHYQF